VAYKRIGSVAALWSDLADRSITCRLASGL
jgi:hypothetical protein